jgi:hypothetical protein
VTPTFGACGMDGEYHKNKINLIYISLSTIAKFWINTTK